MKGQYVGVDDACRQKESSEKKERGLLQMIQGRKLTPRGGNRGGETVVGEIEIVKMSHVGNVIGQATR